MPMPEWADLFDNHGVKIVSQTDKEKSAYVPTADQRLAMKAAGLEPSSGEEKATCTIGVLFDSSMQSMQISYYNSERIGSGRGPEPRIGQGLPRWIDVGDSLVIGNIGNRVFFAREPVPSLGEDFLITEEGDRRTTEEGDLITVPVEPDLDRLARDIEQGRSVLLGSPVELKRRAEIRAHIDELENELSRLTPEHGGIGHNNPPEDDEPESRESGMLATVAESAAALRAELDKEEPDALEVAKAGVLLRNVGRWLAGKGDTFAEEFAKSFGKSLGDTAGKCVGLALLLTTVASWVGKWLQAITWPF